MEQLSQQIATLNKQNEEMQQHRFLTAEAKGVITNTRLHIVMQLKGLNMAVELIISLKVAVDNAISEQRTENDEQLWQEHIRRCNEYREMIAKRNNQLEREGKGGTKERTAGVEHTWKPGVVEAKGAIGNPLCQSSCNYYQILVDELPPHQEQSTTHYVSRLATTTKYC